jgi:hypothetical protein
VERILRSRLQRFLGTESAPPSTLTVGPAPTPRSTPFWQDPNYKTALEKGQDKQDARQRVRTQQQQNSVQ